MKLKKIASLALAGVMAMSMLTACGSTIDDTKEPTQPQEPAVADVVSAVEAGIKSWNSDLEINVESSKNMDAFIEKVFDSNTDLKTINGHIVADLQYVFGLTNWECGDGTKNHTHDFLNPSFITNDDMVNFLNNNSNFAIKAGDTAWTYAIVEVTKASGDANVAAGNLIGEALQNLSNVVDVQKVDDVENKYDHMNVDYTMYVTNDSAVKANNSTVTYVIAVLKADYSAVI